MEDRIEQEVVIEAPIERVWSLLTEAEHLGTWFGDSGAEVDLRPGGELTMSWEEHGTVHARVERVSEPNEFAFRWAAGTDIEPSEGQSTLVEFHLAAAGEATRLSVTESGFTSLASGGQERLKGNIEGWQHELGELGNYAAKVGV